MTKPTYIPEGYYFTVAEIADMQNVIVRTVHQWIEKEWLPALRISGLGYVVNENDLNNFISHSHPTVGYPKGRPRKS